MTAKFKITGTTGFFGEEFRLEKLSKQGDPLEKLNRVIDWNVFFTPIRETLEYGKEKQCRSQTLFSFIDVQDTDTATVL